MPNKSEIKNNNKLAKEYGSPSLIVLGAKNPSIRTGINLSKQPDNLAENNFIYHQKYNPYGLTSSYATVPSVILFRISESFSLTYVSIRNA